MMGLAHSFVLCDILEPLAGILRMIVEEPEQLASQYEVLWYSQLPDPRSAYDRIRAEFNRTREPAKLLYLLARCVKNAVRFNSSGEFNQSPDNRRLGMNPSKMRREIFSAHWLLSGRTTVLAADYREALRLAEAADLVYMDPPYQGVSNGRDPRYAQPLDLQVFVTELRRLNSKGIPFMLSFDGSCGGRSYGEELPPDLELRRILLTAGRSTQATLLGRNEITVESLYLSPALQERIARDGGVRETHIGREAHSAVESLGQQLFD